MANEENIVIEELEKRIEELEKEVKDLKFDLRRVFMVTDLLTMAEQLTAKQLNALEDKVMEES